MINSDKGKVTIKGSDMEIVMDVTCMIQGLADSGIVSEDFLAHAVRCAFMSNEEIEDENKELKAKLKEHLNMLKKLKESGVDFDDLDEELDEVFGDDSGEESDNTFGNIFGDIL